MAGCGSYDSQGWRAQGGRETAQRDGAAPVKRPAKNSARTLRRHGLRRPKSRSTSESDGMRRKLVWNDWWGSSTPWTQSLRRTRSAYATTDTQLHLARKTHPIPPHLPDIIARKPTPPRSTPVDSLLLLRQSRTDLPIPPARRVPHVHSDDLARLESQVHVLIG